VLLAQGSFAPGETAFGFPVPPGTYYVVIENAAPPPILGMALPVGEQIANVAYSLELGERK
jgi:hypothetical protein